MKKQKITTYEQTRLFGDPANDDTYEGLGDEQSPQQLAEKMRDRIMGHLTAVTNPIQNTRIRIAFGMTFLQLALKEGSGTSDDEVGTDVIRIIPAELHAQIMNCIEQLPDENSKRKFYGAFKRLINQELEQWKHGAIGEQSASPETEYAKVA